MGEAEFSYLVELPYLISKCSSHPLVFVCLFVCFLS